MFNQHENWGDSGENGIENSDLPKKVDRRKFLTSAAMVTAGAATVGTGARALASTPHQPERKWHRRIPLKREEHRVVVIGSGFGGGVAALRLAQAGVQVLLLERGRRWATGPNATTFPTMNSMDERALWYESASEIFGRPVRLAPYVGLLETVVGDNITALCAAGLGGGSLVYQGMTLQPSRAVFETQLPAGLDWERMDRVYYPKVKRMLQLATAPDELVNSPTYLAARTFAKNARRAGLPIQKIPMPIDWRYALAELEGRMKPVYTTGDSAIGVNNGGKHSVDVTYIAEAEKTKKVEVRTQHQVTDLAREKNGKWLVSVDRIDATGVVVEQLHITTGAVIMAAGSLGTTRLLLRSAGRGHISDLPDALGAGWGTNADRIYLWTNTQVDFGIKQGGPVVYGSLNWDDPAKAHTVIQASIPALGLNTRSTMLVGYGVSDSRGRFVYDAHSDSAKLKWPRNGDHEIFSTAIDPTVRRIAGKGNLVTDTNSLLNTTWHPLGGASMGTVCDLDGRVDGQRGLYVLDGALIPGTAAACNPSMTIAAVAERALDQLIKNDLGTLI